MKEQKVYLLPHSGKNYRNDNGLIHRGNSEEWCPVFCVSGEQVFAKIRRHHSFSGLSGGKSVDLEFLNLPAMSAEQDYNCSDRYKWFGITTEYQKTKQVTERTLFFTGCYYSYEVTSHVWNACFSVNRADKEKIESVIQNLDTLKSILGIKQFNDDYIITVPLYKLDWRRGDRQAYEWLAYRAWAYWNPNWDPDNPDGDGGCKPDYDDHAPCSWITGQMVFNILTNPKTAGLLNNILSQKKIVTVPQAIACGNVLKKAVESQPKNEQFAQVYWAKIEACGYTAVKSHLMARKPLRSLEQPKLTRELPEKMSYIPPKEILIAI